MKPLRILIADDHSLVRRGVRALLETHPGWHVCGEAVTGKEAVEQAKRLKPDTIVMDISMPEMNGLEATRYIRGALPECEVVVLSMHESEEMAREVMKAGARAFVLKSDLDRNLLAAIESLTQHKTYLSSSLTEMLIEGYLKDSPRPTVGRLPLTARQRTVVRLLALGKTNKEVAAALGISVKTVEAHRTQIMSRLNLQSFSELVRYAVRQGIVDA
ncbi:MAG TPA: response regulator transcription factor [Terriglobia bacterium]|nr:response regulator transcription factor [Terriglobia bacterium]